MTPVSGAFSAVGVSVLGSNYSSGDVPFAIAGTFAGTVILEKATSSGLAWKTVAGPFTGPASGVLRSDAQSIHRFRCTAYTSGSVGYSFTPSGIQGPTLGTLPPLAYAAMLTNGSLYDGGGYVAVAGTSAPAIQFALGYRGAGFVPDPENTFIGVGAGGTNLTTAVIESTAVGYLAGGGQSTGNVGNRNTSVGFASLSFITSGASNVAIGNNVMYGELTGNFNTMVGADVARNVVGCSESIGIGAQAFYNTVPTNSIAIGFQALLGQAGATSLQNVVIANNGLCSAALVAATSNVVIGFNVANGAALTSPANNTIVGTTILSGSSVLVPTLNVLSGQGILIGNSVVSPGSNVMIGNNIANSAAVSPTQNTFVGHSIANALISGSGNVSIGVFSSRILTTGGSNVVAGNSTANKLTTGSNNLILGANVASTTLATGSSNIYIGASSAIDAATAAEGNTFRLGNNATNLMRATGINTATPAFFLDWMPASTTYANDAAAATGLVAIGQLYRNGSVVQCRIS